MKRLLIILVCCLAVGACAEEANSPADSAAASSPPLHQFKPLYDAKDAATAGLFLLTHPESPNVGGHEFDGIVLGMGRSHDKPSSLRMVVLARDGQVWVVDPWNDTNADNLAALFGRGDWVIVHKHWVEGTTTVVQGGHDVRLVEKYVPGDSDGIG